MGSQQRLKAQVLGTAANKGSTTSRTQVSTNIYKVRGAPSHKDTLRKDDTLLDPQSGRAQHRKERGW